MRSFFRRPMSLGIKMALLVCVYLGAWLLAECAGRVYLVWRGVPWNSALAMFLNDDLLGYRPHPLFSIGATRFNSMGFRARGEYSPYPPEGTLRILAAGGSTTFGSGGFTLEEAYPAQLEGVLREAGTDCEVINAGVNGWQILQIRHSLEEWIGMVHPDIVILNSCWNTGLEPYKYYKNEDWITYPLFQYSFLFRLLDRRLRNVDKSFHYRPFLQTREQMCRRQEEINSTPAVFDAYEGHLRTIAAACQRNGVALVCLVPPGNLPDGIPDPAGYFAGSPFEQKAPDYEQMCLAVNRTRNLAVERIRKLQGESGFQVVDARSLFDGLPNTERRALFYDELHLVPEGNGLLAEFIAASIRTQIETTTLSTRF